MLGYSGRRHAGNGYLIVILERGRGPHHVGIPRDIARGGHYVVSEAQGPGGILDVVGPGGGGLPERGLRGHPGSGGPGAVVPPGRARYRRIVAVVKRIQADLYTNIRNGDIIFSRAGYVRHAVMGLGIGQRDRGHRLLVVVYHHNADFGGHIGAERLAALRSVLRVQGQVVGPGHYAVIGILVNRVRQIGLQPVGDGV